MNELDASRTRKLEKKVKRLEKQMHALKAQMKQAKAVARIKAIEDLLGV